MDVLADRYGQKTVLVASLMLSPGLVAVFALVGGAVGAVAVCLAGAVIVSTFSVTTVMGQEYLPSKIAMASGMTVGLAMGLGGIGAVLLCVIADSVDLRAALLATAAGPALGALAALWLPREQQTRIATPALAAKKGNPHEAPTSVA